MKKSLIALVPLAIGASAISTGAATQDLHTTQAVIAVDDAWLQAEVNGDEEALRQLLLPEYRSVSVDGRITTGAQLISRAEQRGADPAMAAAVQAWRQSHPVQPRVRIDGDMAILTWELAAEAGAKVSSCDIFIYRDGRWRAAYSQHSTASS